MIEGITSLIRGKRPLESPGWMERAWGSEVSEVSAFARKLSRDESALRPGIVMEWGNGQEEGHVNRLRAVRRALFGRARFDLLRARVLATL